MLTPSRRPGSTGSGREPTSQIDGDPAAQQAIRWNLFQLAQASAQIGERGIAAKAVTAGGYDGPLLLGHRGLRAPVPGVHQPRMPHATCSSSATAILPAGPRRAIEMSPARRAVPVAHDQRRGGLGVLPGRHRPVPHRRRRGARHRPLRRPPPATSSSSRDEGAEMLVEMARLFADLGFYDQADPPRSTSTASPGPTSTRLSSTTTSTPT